MKRLFHFEELEAADRGFGVVIGGLEHPNNGAGAGLEDGRSAHSGSSKWFVGLKCVAELLARGFCDDGCGQFFSSIQDENTFANHDFVGPQVTENVFWFGAFLGKSPNLEIPLRVNALFKNDGFRITVPKDCHAFVGAALILA